MDPGKRVPLPGLCAVLLLAGTAGAGCGQDLLSGKRFECAVVGESCGNGCTCVAGEAGTGYAGWCQCPGTPAPGGDVPACAPNDHPGCGDGGALFWFDSCGKQGDWIRDCPEGCSGGACNCSPACDGRVCGDDGCGGSCGSCGLGTACIDGSCQACTPDCQDRECGDDGCGGTCGSCAGGWSCSYAGRCSCLASCGGRQCGDDGCGGSCGSCPAGQSCSNGTCTGGCKPDCSGATCGDDGCGGSCGTCPGGWTCAFGSCSCPRQCSGRECGDDGCGGTCGSCPGGQSCSNGLCHCTPSCQGKECGPDGCGGACGSCSPGMACSAASQCVPKQVLPTTWGPTGVVTSLETPADGTIVTATCFDYSGDGQGDNGIKSLAGQVNGPLADGVTGGDIVLLAEFLGVTSFSNTASFALNALNGSLVSGTDYLVVQSSYDPESSLPLASLSGASISSGGLAAGPADFFLTVSMSGSPTTVRIEHVRVRGTIASGSASGVTVTDGVMGGIITKATIDELIASLQTTCDAAPADARPDFCAYLATAKSAAPLLYNLHDNGDGTYVLKSPEFPGNASSICFRFTTGPGRITGMTATSPSCTCRAAAQPPLPLGTLAAWLLAAAVFLGVPQLRRRRTPRAR